MTTSDNDTRQYWLWVTRPEYYLDEDKNERQDLDPANGNDADGWWTCHKDTLKGDFVFLWRTRPKCDIGYLIQAASDAYSITDDEDAVKQGWDYGCDYQVLYKFSHPITIQDLHTDPYFQDWGTYRGQFRRRVSRIPIEYWKKLNQLAAAKNTDYGVVIANLQQEPVFRRILLEEQLEEALVHNLALLRPFGYDLELYVAPATGVGGRQLVCRGHGGRIDLLCVDRYRARYVVIELKNVRAGQNTFGQIFTYIGWVQENIAGNVPVIGLVISRGYDARFAASVQITDRVFHVNLSQLGFE